MTKLTRTASLRGASPDEKRLSFTIISRDNDAERFSWEKGRYIERLDIKGARYAGLRTLFTDHDPSVDNAIARVEDVRVENGELVCDCVFSDDERSRSIYRKYEQGILSDVSIGYMILKDEELKDDTQKRLTIVREFEIFELSAVWKGADSGAKKRASDEKSELAKASIDIKRKKLDLKERQCQM